MGKYFNCWTTLLACFFDYHGDEEIVQNRLKVYRAMHNLTQEKLAIKLGVTRATINAIENGRYDPSLKLAFQIARFSNDVYDKNGHGTQTVSLVCGNRK